MDIRRVAHFEAQVSRGVRPCADEHRPADERSKFFAAPGGGAAPRAAPKAEAAPPPASKPEVVDLMDDDEPPAKVAVTPTATRAKTEPESAAAAPASAGKRARSPTPKQPKKSPKRQKDATPAKPTYPRPPMRPESELNFSVGEAAVWQGGRAETMSTLDAASLPRGADDCLSGETFVLTGNLPHLSREDADALIKRHGGRVTGSVTGKTTFLLVGADSGNSKYSKAKELKTPLIDEEGLFALILASAPFAAAPARAAPVAAPAAAPAAPPVSRAPPPRPETGNASGAGPSRPPAGPPLNQLWVEKHKPSSVAQLVGNGKLIADLRAWLNDWQRTHLGHAVVPKGKDAPKKAVLISGPPGIGKTSAAKIICRALGFDVMEVNASDARGKAESDVKTGLNGKCANMVKEMVTNCAVSFDGTVKKQALIMDEVDGMSGGDRGGVQDLINSIKVSKIPIICICNDRWSQKLRSLQNHCLELQFHRPTKQQIRSRMLQIALQEGLKVNDIAMEALIESCNSDIRLVLNTLQMRRLNSDTLQFDDAKSTATKDLELGAFNATDKLMSSDARMPINERSNLVFQDSDIIPLFVQENYVNMRPAAAGMDELRRMELVARASACIADGDVLTTAVRRHQRWTLMPYAVVTGCVQPAAILRGRREAFGLFPGERNFNRFPAWLGKNSTQGKQRRLLSELQTHAQLSGTCTANRSAVREEYMPAMRLALTAPMWGTAHGGREKDGIPQVMAMMNDYSLTRDDWEALLDMTKIKAEGVPPGLRDPASLIPTAVKSAFTRECNKDTRSIRSGILLPDAKKKRKAKAADDADMVDDEFADDEEEGEESADEEPKHDPKRLATLAKRGVQLNLKEGVTVAKGKKPAAAKGKAASGAAAKGKAKKA